MRLSDPRSQSGLDDKKKICVGNGNRTKVIRPASGRCVGGCALVPSVK